MKWLLGLMLFFALAMAVLLVPIEGRTLWSRGAVREVAQFVAHGLRAGWDAVGSLSKEARPASHALVTPARQPTRSAVRRRAAEPQTTPGPRTSREGIVQQAPKETLHAEDQAALDNLITHAR
jgi:hypothetical protein